MGIYFTGMPLLASLFSRPIANSLLFPPRRPTSPNFNRTTPPKFSPRACWIGDQRATALVLFMRPPHTFTPQLHLSPSLWGSLALLARSVPLLAPQTIPQGASRPGEPLCSAGLSQKRAASRETASSPPRGASCHASSTLTWQGRGAQESRHPARPTVTAGTMVDTRRLALPAGLG